MSTLASTFASGISSCIMASTTLLYSLTHPDDGKHGMNRMIYAYSKVLEKMSNAAFAVLVPLKKLMFLVKKCGFQLIDRLSLDH